MTGRHRADGGDGYSVRGRDNRGAEDGHQTSGRPEGAEAPYDPALAERHAADHAQRRDGER